ncbi:MAG TPA: RHS repeat-associated core domain-containing protein, partial [Candidatus Angelobacter sp.]|nr:RHS repeat-associated core domain-containing protein [Candidatus Angelobacter sp.]
MTPGIVAESDLVGNLKTEYVFFDGERVARRDFPAGNVSYYFSDHLKTASVVTDASGAILDESDYYPWGGELPFTNNLDNHYKFTGKERDTETGLDYFGARYYSNGLGRFITPDWAAKASAVPYADFADPQSLNLYTYVRNIPTTRVDADGHDGFLDTLKQWFQHLIQPAMDVHASKGATQPTDTSVYSPLTHTTSREIVVDVTDHVATATQGLYTLFSPLDFTGFAGLMESAAKDDKGGALMGMAFTFLHIPGGGRISMAEAKSLIGGWSKGSFESAARSISR